MDETKFIQILDRRLEQLDALVGKGYNDPDFRTWLTTTEELIVFGYGEKSRQHNDFKRVHFTPMVMGTTSAYEDSEAYEKGTTKVRSLLKGFRENVEDFGLPATASVSGSTNSPKPKPGLTQNFFISQNQAQAVMAQVDIKELDEDVRERLTELLAELEKKHGKNKTRIAELIRWLADRSIDVLIALLTAGRQ